MPALPSEGDETCCFCVSFCCCWLVFVFFFFLFSFLKYKEMRRGGEKSLPTCFYKKQSSKKVCMAVYLQGLVLNAKIIIFFPSV